MSNVLYFKTSYKPDFEARERLDRLQGQFSWTVDCILHESKDRYEEVARIQSLANTLRSKWRIYETVAGIKHCYKFRA